MRWKIRWTTETVFLISGLLIVLLGWVSDLIGALNGELGAGQHGAGDILSRIWFTFFGLLFVAGGTAYEQPWRLLNDSKFAKRYFVSLLFFADGAFHLYAFNDHLNESAIEALYFAVLAPAQFTFGLIISQLPPRYDPYILVWPAFLLGLLALALFVPIWPLSTIEDLYSLTVVSKLVEVLTVIVLLSLMRDDGTLNWRTIKGAVMPLSER